MLAGRSFGERAEIRGWCGGGTRRREGTRHEIGGWCGGGTRRRNGMPSRGGRADAGNGDGCSRCRCRGDGVIAHVAGVDDLFQLGFKRLEEGDQLHQGQRRGRNEVRRRHTAEGVRGHGDVRRGHRGQIGEHARDMVQNLPGEGVDHGDDVPDPVREIGEAVILGGHDDRVVFGGHRHLVLVIQGGVEAVLVEIGATGIGDRHEGEQALGGCCRIGRQPRQFGVGDQRSGRQADDGHVLARADFREGGFDGRVEVVDADGDGLSQGEALGAGDRVCLLRPGDAGALVSGEFAAEYLGHDDIGQVGAATDPVEHEGLVGAQSRRRG